MRINENLLFYQLNTELGLFSYAIFLSRKLVSDVCILIPILTRERQLLRVDMYNNNSTLILIVRHMKSAFHLVPRSKTLYKTLS